MPLKTKLLDYTGERITPDEETMARMERLAGLGQVLLTDDRPDVFWFLSGGSERYARDLADPKGHYLLIGSKHGNSYASATEVKAWMNASGISSLLLGEEEPETGKVISLFRQAREGVDRLRGQRLGVIGRVSDWLIASDVAADRLLERFGLERIDLNDIDWSVYPGCEPSPDFLNYYADYKDYGLIETARVSELLSTLIRDHDLDAITVECFPLVRDHRVTACLPLARFNDLGLPAGCEGDLTALVGMMLGKELTGTVPWIANLNRVSETGCLFSHCTIAPGLIGGLSVMTHYETGEGTAIQGRFRSNQVTIFRLDNHLRKAFIASGTVTGRPREESACRTQIEVKLAPEDVRLLREQPLGNHHLVFPFDCVRLLEVGCWVADINRVVNS